jgi:hypothetical protein
MARLIQFKIGGDLITGNLSGGLFITTEQFESTPITLEYDTYFQYSNSQGLPVYDENTGQQLVDPLS